jgi:hypothetical protein
MMTDQEDIIAEHLRDDPLHARMASFNTINGIRIATCATRFRIAMHATISLNGSGNVTDPTGGVPKMNSGARATTMTVHVTVATTCLQPSGTACMRALQVTEA